MLLVNIIKLRENLELKSSRIIIGILICTAFFLSFFLKLELILLLLISIFSFYELILNKIFNKKSLISSVLILIVYLFFDNLLSSYFVYFSIIFILFLFFYKKFFELFVPIIITIFLIEMYKLILVDRNMFYTLLLVCFINDTFAYIIGKNIGGKLIIPSISPKKTWSGTIGSFSISFVIFIFMSFSLFQSVVLSASLFIGDIFFSLVKRKFEIKDFSNILKSHGGILDRLDSFILLLLIFKLFSLIYFL